MPTYQACCHKSCSVHVATWGLYMVTKSNARRVNCTARYASFSCICKAQAMGNIRFIAHSSMYAPDFADV